jgi:hypothetical protein
MKKEKISKDDFRMVRKFISQLTPVEFRCAELTMQMVSAFKTIINRHKLSKADFCELFHIKPNKYNDYVRGNYNYTVNDMSTLNYVYNMLEAKKIQENQMVEVITENKDTHE